MECEMARIASGQENYFSRIKTARAFFKSLRFFLST
jgi:hypothetical protein